MAVEAVSLIAPAGPVEKELFPGEYEDDNDDLLERLTSYVNQGVLKITGLGLSSEAADAAVKAWALYLAFKAAYVLSLSRPADDDAQSTVMGRTMFEKDQREALKELADGYLSEYQIYVDDAADGSSAASTGVPSHQIQNLFEY